MRLAATDHALLRRWRTRGDPAAFAVLVERHAAMVHSASMRVVHNRALAQEIAQDCFLKLTQLNRFGGTSLGAWLHCVATNRALDIAKAEARRRARESAYAESHDAPASPAESTALLDEIDAALAALPDDLSELIVLHYLEGATHKEIARRLRTSRPTITRKLHLALEQLRERLTARGITATAAILLAALESARATAAPAALIAALRKLALSNPPTITAAPAAALFSPSTIALAGTVALLLFLAAVLIPQLVKANGDDATPAPIVARAEPPTAVAEPASATEPEIVLAENQEPETIEPAAPARATESVTLKCVDLSQKPVPGAEVYFARAQPLVYPAFAIDRPEDIGITVYGPFESDANGHVAVPPIEHPIGNEIIAYQAFARIPGQLAGAWRLWFTPNRPRPADWDQIVLMPSAPFLGRVTVPSGFDVTKVTVRLLGAHFLDGQSRTGGMFENASKFTESTIPPFAAQHPDANGRLQFNDLPIEGRIYLAATASGLAETQFFTFERVPEFHIDMVRESTLSGTVRYVPGNAPAVNVSVFARPETGSNPKLGVSSDFITRTDGTGRFQFTGLPEAHYNVRVFPQGNPPEWVASVKLDVPVGLSENAGPVDIALERGGWVEGVVRDRKTGAPIPNAQLCAVNPVNEAHNNEAIALVQTDAEGRYRVLLPVGTSNLYLFGTPPGYKSPEKRDGGNVTIVANQPAPVKLDFELMAAEPIADPGRALITGRVIDPAGNPLVGVPVVDSQVYTDGERSYSYAFRLGSSKGDGSFLFYIEARGTHAIRIGGELYNPGVESITQYSRVVREAFTAEKDQTYDLGDFILERYTLSLGGTVTDEDGNPLHGMNVYVGADRDNFLGISKSTDYDGEFVMKFFPKGVFKLTVSDARGRYETINLDVEPGFDYEIAMKRKSAETTPK